MLLSEIDFISCSFNSQINLHKKQIVLVNIYKGEAHTVMVKTCRQSSSVNLCFWLIS